MRILYSLLLTKKRNYAQPKNRPNINRLNSCKAVSYSIVYFVCLYVGPKRVGMDNSIFALGFSCFKARSAHYS